MEGVIEISPQANPVVVLAEVLFNIQNSLTPYPKAQAVDELFQSMQPDEIWNGPLLSLGALDKESLKPLKRTVELQEIVKIILQTPGVKLIKELRLVRPDAEHGEQRIPIQEGCFASLEPSILKPQDPYTIDVEREGAVKWRVDSKAVWARIQELEAGIRNREAYAARSAQATEYVHGPSGKYKEVESYFSIQHQFPVVYGLSKYGIPEFPLKSLGLASSKERQAQVQQLKAYLLFFEQLLANYLSQLAHVGDLLSLNEELQRSYFYQRLAHEPAWPSEPQKIADVLIQIPESTRKSASHYFIHVVNQNGTVGLISDRLATRGQAEELRDRIIENGANIRNYRIRQTNGGEYRLVLFAPGGDSLAFGPERFSSPGAAQLSAGRWVAGVIGVKNLQDLVRIHRSEDLTVQVMDERFRVVLTSTGIESQEEREKRISEIIACGSDMLNYHSVATLRGGKCVHLHNSRGELLAEGEETFETEFEAEQGIEKLAELMTRIAQGRLPRDSHIGGAANVEPISKSPLQAYWASLAGLERQHDGDYLVRRNKILNHLLARFGEAFDDDILQQLDVRPYGEKDDFYYELIRWKIEFLREYIEPLRKETGDGVRHGQNIGLGSGRGQAFDYSRASSVSGLEQRLTLLLGIHGHMEDKQYSPVDTNERSLEPPGFYYVEKQVSSPKWEEAEDNEHDHGDGKQHKYKLLHHRIQSGWREAEPNLRDLHHQFVFSSEDSGVLRDLLQLGIDRKNYSLRPMPDGYQVLFRAPNSNYDLEVHRAIGKKEAEEAISSLIRYLQQLKESTAQSHLGERIWVVEHVLLRPRGPIEHRPVRIHHESGIHLSSPLLPESQRHEHLELILQHGQRHENYRIETDALGNFVLVLYHQQRPIACTHKMRNQEEAAAAIPELAGLIYLISTSTDKKKHERHVHQDEHDTFYSQRISVLLPNWPLRFQSNEFKLYAEEMVQENSPAHLATNVFWLSAHEAKEFDKMYSHWKSLSVDVHGGRSDNKMQELDEASDKLRVFLQKLQREQELWAASTTGEQ